MPCDLFEDEREHDHDHEHHPKPPCDCAYGECKRDIVQHTDICVPVDIDPSATVGRIITECCGDPIVECRHEHCDNTCKIKITQRLKITIPITFSVVTCSDDPIITCCKNPPFGD